VPVVDDQESLWGLAVRMFQIRCPSLQPSLKWDMMRKFKGISVCVAVIGGTHSAFAADPIHGEEIARRWCAECHVVVNDQRQVLTQAPPFSAIARNPAFDAYRLAFFLLEPHPKMPSMSLTRNEAADLAAYIASLK
jgi:mono/diheme cytochrome c family protein